MCETCRYIHTRSSKSHINERQLRQSPEASIQLCDDARGMARNQSPDMSTPARNMTLKRRLQGARDSPAALPAVSPAKAKHVHCSPVIAWHHAIQVLKRVLNHRMPVLFRSMPGHVTFPQRHKCSALSVPAVPDGANSCMHSYRFGCSGAEAAPRAAHPVQDS